MARENRLQPACRLVLAALWIVQQISLRIASVISVPLRDKAKIARAKQTLPCPARRGNQRNAAGERLKHADRRDARHRAARIAGAEYAPSQTRRA